MQIDDGIGHPHDVLAVRNVRVSRVAVVVECEQSHLNHSSEFEVERSGSQICQSDETLGCINECLQRAIAVIELLSENTGMRPNFDSVTIDQSTAIERCPPIDTNVIFNESEHWLIRLCRNKGAYLTQGARVDRKAEVVACLDLNLVESAHA